MPNNTSINASRFDIARPAYNEGTHSYENFADNIMESGNINATGNVNDFLTYLLQKSFLENGEPSTVFMRF